jgi:hypothetical protein
MKYINEFILNNQFPRTTDYINNFPISKYFFDLTTVSYAEICEKVFEEMGFYAEIKIERYGNGIFNWNYQIFWLNEEKEWEGTGLYGDSGQCNDRLRCKEYSIERCFKIVEDYLEQGTFKITDLKGTYDLQQDEYFAKYFE